MPQRGNGLLGITVRAFVYRALSRGAMAAGAIITARQLGPSGRGVLVLLLTGATFSLLLCTLGITVSGRVHLVARTDPVSSGEYLGLAAVLTVLQVTVCLGLGVSLLPAVDVRLAAIDLILFGIVGGGLIAQYFLNASLNAYGRTSLAAAVDAAGSMVQLLLVVILAIVNADDLTPFLMAIGAANAFQTSVAMAALHRSGVTIWPRRASDQWIRLIKTGVPGIPMGLAEVLTFRLDHYLVGAFLSPQDVGVYSVAATAPELLRLLSVALGPSLFHRLASGSAKVVDFRSTRLLGLMVTALLAAAMFAAAPLAVHTLLGPQYAGAVSPLRILLLAEVGANLFYLDSSSLGGLNRLADAAWASVAGLIMVVVCDIALIPTLGIAGAAWASVLAYSVMGLVAHLLLRRQVALTGR